ncbi:MAG: hypothetical protein GTO17_05740 [Candidatus Aminicenantes bacterium]|nr:hypothetical protein [Candidatus Aminicenantes bacterium]
MNKKEYYLQELKKLKDWKPYLLQESQLPGRRANLELLQAAVDLGSERLFNELRRYDARRAPTNSPYEFLAMCGVVGLGKLIIEGEERYFNELRCYASDSRWRIREGVAFALQIVGKKSPKKLLEEMEEWKKGNPYEKRAVAAGLCEPGILKEKWFIKRVFEMLDTMTSSVENIKDRQDEGFRVLKKGLSYCWSVAVVSFPQEGKKYMEKWIQYKDQDIGWIMKENLKKNRLQRMDASWVAGMKANLD